MGHRARGGGAVPARRHPADVYFDAEATWVARRIGEPSVLDEDLALAYQTEVLKAQLAREIQPRAHVPAGTHGGGRLKRTFNQVVDVVDFFDPDTSNEPPFDPPATAGRPRFSGG